MKNGLGAFVYDRMTEEGKRKQGRMRKEGHVCTWGRGIVSAGGEAGGISKISHFSAGKRGREGPATWRRPCQPPLSPRSPSRRPKTAMPGQGKACRRVRARRSPQRLGAQRCRECGVVPTYHTYYVLCMVCRYIPTGLPVLSASRVGE